MLMAQARHLPKANSYPLWSDHVTRLRRHGRPTADGIRAEEFPGIRAVSLAVLVTDHVSQPGNNFVTIAVHEPVKKTIVVEVRVHKAFLASIYIVGM